MNTSVKWREKPCTKNEVCVQGRPAAGVHSADDKAQSATNARNREATVKNSHAAQILSENKISFLLTMTKGVHPQWMYMTGQTEKKRDSLLDHLSRNVFSMTHRDFARKLQSSQSIKIP
jgi:hypothetical protein